MELEINRLHRAKGYDSKLMIDKNEVIQALSKLIDEYPSELIPRNVVRDVFLKFLGTSALATLSEHPSICKLEQTLIKAKSVTSS